MDPLSISLAIAPLLLASAKLTKQINDFADSYRNATTTLASICTECKLIHVALCKIQGLVYQSSSVLTARLKSEKSLRDAFDSALTGCRMTVAAVDVEIRKLIDPEALSQRGKAEVSFKRKLRYVWKEDLMQNLLDHTRGQMASIQFLISLLQSETLSEILKLVQTNKEPLRKNFSKARSLRSSQGFEDALSTFDSDGRSIAHDVIPTYEEQLQRSTAYQRAQAATAQDLLAAKLELLEAKYTLEEKVDDLELDINLKESLVSDLRSQVAVKDASIAHMVLELQRRDESRKMELKKDQLIAVLNDEIASSNRQAEHWDQHDLLTLEPLIPDTKSQGFCQPSDMPDIYIQILGRTWSLHSLRTPPYNSSAPNILFYWAASNGDAEAARFIYETTNVDERYIDPKTDMNALQIASTQNFSCVVETLLSLGLTSGHHQALQIAVDKGHLEIVRMLHVFGARLSQLPLSAVQNGYEEIVKILVGDNVDVSDPGLLECAVTNRHNEIVKALSSKDRPLRKPKNKREQNHGHKKTPLETASFSGDTARLHETLRNSPGQPMNTLISALYYAICTLQGPCLRILLDYLVHKVDQGSVGTNIMFRKALGLAVCMGNTEMIGILKESQYDRKLSPDLADHGDSRLMDLHQIVQSELARQPSLVPNSKPELRRKLEEGTRTPGESWARPPRSPLAY